MPRYSREELQQFREEIFIFSKRKKTLRGIGWLCIISSIICLIIFWSLSNEPSISDMNIALYSSIFLFCAGIIIFITKSALYNPRIKIRRQIIRQAKEEYEIDRMFENENEGD